MKRLIKYTAYLAEYRSQVLLYFMFSLLGILFALFSFGMLVPVLQLLFTDSKPNPGAAGLLAKVTNYIYDFSVAHGKMTALSYTAIVVVIATTLKNLFVYLSAYILNPLRNAILRRLRNDLFTKTLSLPIGFFTEERKGDLMSRMTNDVNELETSILSVLEIFIRDPLAIIITLATMIYISPQLTLFLLLFLPFAGLVIGKIGKSLKRPSNLAQQYLGTILGIIDETLVGMRVIKAFNAERHQYLRFMEVNNTLFRVRNKIAARKELGSPLSETMGIIVVCIILLYGGNLIFSGHTAMTGPVFIWYISLFYQIITPFKNISSAYNNAQKGAAALDRIEHLLTVENSLKELPDAKPVTEFNTAIELRNVQFAYGDKKILGGIDILVPKGKTVALVGASGAGKSTLVDLIPRFHDVTGGEILLDGINIKEYKLSDLRRLMGVVGQDPVLFNDTIYNNITLGTGGATQEQVEDAARIANAHNFITQKSEGYQTVAGDRGSRLSGGERQRVTIARAVLKNPPILILDEATSSLDTESERMVQDAINNLMKNRTCIVIAHRLSTVQHADEIIVLDKGQVAERGTHFELIKLDGLYKKLVELQQVK